MCGLWSNPFQKSNRNKQFNWLKPNTSYKSLLYVVTDDLNTLQVNIIDLLI